MTRDHAERIREVFEEMYPQHVGLLQVIIHGMERVHDGPYGDGLITKFKKQDKPRIAVSVDMLDTGVDIPEVVNLVFMKPVQSRIKLWQMIGRGTRNQEACRYYDRLPDGRKTEFLIIDFWQNDFGRQTDDTVPAEMPVLVRLFNTRLDLLEATLPRPRFASPTAGRARIAGRCSTASPKIPSPCARSGPRSNPHGQTASGSTSPASEINSCASRWLRCCASRRTWTWPPRHSPTRSSA